VPRTITLLRPATDGAGGADTKVNVVPLIEKSWPGIWATPATNTVAALLPWYVNDSVNASCVPSPSNRSTAWPPPCSAPLAIKSHRPAALSVANEAVEV
jgi:hypothetical protein